MKKPNYSLIMQLEFTNIVTTSMDGFEITTAAAATLTGTMTIYGKR